MNPHKHQWLMVSNGQWSCATCNAPMPKETKAASQLRLALRVAAISHTYSMAQVVGVYPA